jgi:hypothetical protein
VDGNCHFVDVAPHPLLAGLERRGQGVAGCSGVAGSMPVARRVTAAHLTARQADPQVHPRAAADQALGASIHAVWDDVGDLIEVDAPAHRATGFSLRFLHTMSIAPNPAVRTRGFPGAAPWVTGRGGQGLRRRGQEGTPQRVGTERRSSVRVRRVSPGATACVPAHSPGGRHRWPRADDLSVRASERDDPPSAATRPATDREPSSGRPPRRGDARPQVAEVRVRHLDAERADGGRALRHGVALGDGGLLAPS